MVADALCPFCGKPPKAEPNASFPDVDMLSCSECDEGYFPREVWNTRPIEDGLRKRIAELEAELKQLKEAYG